MGSDQKYCERARSEGQNCECEGKTASEFSPGPVQNDELLIRSVFTADVDPNTGYLSNGFFNDVTSQGLSVDRGRYTTAEELQNRANAKASRKNATNAGIDDFSRQEFLGFVVLSAHSVRNMLHADLRRRVCICDTALEENVSHADLCAAQKVSKVQRTALREDLLQIAGATVRPPHELEGVCC